MTPSASPPVGLGVAAVAAMCLLTLWLGLSRAGASRTTSDFYVASRAVSARRNASAITGEYLSAASFLGLAGLMWAGGADQLWLPVGYTVGYVMLLVLIAAPLRRSGAYTLPDFAEDRLESRRVRRVVSLLVVGTGWVYLLVQLQTAGVALALLTGAPTWVGPLLVAAVVLTVVSAGGMRTITLVQSWHYWIKLVALWLPALVLGGVWLRAGAPAPRLPPGQLQDWTQPLSGYGGREHPLYLTWSSLLGQALGTMALPHVVVRYYTIRDGRAARRTTVAVVGLISAFYLALPLYGILGRVYVSSLPPGASSDTMMLRLPLATLPGLGGELLTTLLAAGAFVAFLSTASGLVVALAGVLDQDLVAPSLLRLTSGDVDRLHSFRIAAALAVVVPLMVVPFVAHVGVNTVVIAIFAVTASTFAPLLVLGVWWPRLSRAGTLASIGVGATLAVGATALGIAGVGEGWPRALLVAPAAWTAPAAFATAVVVSLLTPGSVPRSTTRTMVRLHTPEALPLDR
ncbi:sodium/solute symporter [Arsenicicoccus sp. oral taxon 190]|uniref:sodium/solute symporter n=1 Tax=Arsenicicoccus sp. oral taxon 190 TaxID=1658671 RepID=UPI000679F297|nr:cation acetate symporter [Arsenicicoccus sp. oral taxon 190]AKT51140.1 transporter [Arsenicicoccus sp. oral taxon 190]